MVNIYNNGSFVVNIYEVQMLMCPMCKSKDIKIVKDFGEGEHFPEYQVNKCLKCETNFLRSRK